MSKLSYIIILLVLPTVLHAVDSPSPAPASTSSPTLAPTPSSPSPSSPTPSSPSPNTTPPLDSSPPPQQLSPPPSSPSKSAKSSSKGRTGGQKAGIAIGVLAATGLLVFGGMVYKTRRSNIRRAQMSSAARRAAP